MLKSRGGQPAGGDLYSRDRLSEAELDLVFDKNSFELLQDLRAFEHRGFGRKRRPRKPTPHEASCPGRFRGKRPCLDPVPLDILEKNSQRIPLRLRRCKVDGLVKTIFWSFLSTSS